MRINIHKSILNLRNGTKLRRKNNIKTTQKMFQDQTLEKKEYYNTRFKTNGIQMKHVINIYRMRK